MSALASCETHVHNNQLDNSLHTEFLTLYLKIGRVLILMPQRYKTPAGSRRPHQPVIRTIYTGDRFSQSLAAEKTASEVRHRHRFYHRGLFSYPYFVVSAYQRYPKHRPSILVSHFFLCILLFATIATLSSVIQFCYTAHKPVSSFLLDLGRSKVLKLATTDMTGRY